MFKKFIQLLILLIHFSLLAWILYILFYGGRISMDKMIYHFIGIGILGVFSIIGTAKIEMAFFTKEQKKRHKKK